MEVQPNLCRDLFKDLKEQQSYDNDVTLARLEDLCDVSSLPDTSHYHIAEAFEEMEGTSILMQILNNLCPSGQDLPDKALPHVTCLLTALLTYSVSDVDLREELVDNDGIKFLLSLLQHLGTDIKEDDEESCGVQRLALGLLQCLSSTPWLHEALIKEQAEMVLTPVRDNHSDETCQHQASLILDKMEEISKCDPMERKRVDFDKPRVALRRLPGYHASDAARHQVTNLCASLLDDLWKQKTYADRLTENRLSDLNQLVTMLGADRQELQKIFKSRKAYDLFVKMLISIWTPELTLEDWCVGPLAHCLQTVVNYCLLDKKFQKHFPAGFSKYLAYLLDTVCKDEDIIDVKEDREFKEKDGILLSRATLIAFHMFACNKSALSERVKMKLCNHYDEPCSALLKWTTTLPDSAHRVRRICKEGNNKMEIDASEKLQQCKGLLEHLKSLHSYDGEAEESLEALEALTGVGELPEPNQEELVQLLKAEKAADLVFKILPLNISLPELRNTNIRLIRACFSLVLNFTALGLDTECSSPRVWFEFLTMLVQYQMNHGQKIRADVRPVVRCALALLCTLPPPSIKPGTLIVASGLSDIPCSILATCAILSVPQDIVWNKVQLASAGIGRLIDLLKKESHSDWLEADGWEFHISFLISILARISSIKVFKDAKDESKTLQVLKKCCAENDASSDDPVGQALKQHEKRSNLCCFSSARGDGQDLELWSPADVGNWLTQNMLHSLKPSLCVKDGHWLLSLLSKPSKVVKNILQEMVGPKSGNTIDEFMKALNKLGRSTTD